MFTDGETVQAVINRVRLTREALGLIPAAMARLMGVSQQHWAHWERTRVIPWDAAAKLCSLTGVHMDWIYRGLRVGLPHDFLERIAELERQAERKRKAGSETLDEDRSAS